MHVDFVLLNTFQRLVFIFKVTRRVKCFKQLYMFHLIQVDQFLSALWSIFYVSTARVRIMTPASVLGKWLLVLTRWVTSGTPVFLHTETTVTAPSLPTGVTSNKLLIDPRLMHTYMFLFLLFLKSPF